MSVLLSTSPSYSIQLFSTFQTILLVSAQYLFKIYLGFPHFLLSGKILALLSFNIIISSFYFIIYKCATNTILVI